MANKDRFTPEEWEALVRAPRAAFGAIVATDRPGLIALVKEATAARRSARAARQTTGWPGVVAELIAYQEQHEGAASKAPDIKDFDAVLLRSLDALSAAGQAAQKLTAVELEDYVTWVLGIATAAAEAVNEQGTSSPVSDEERHALADIEHRLRHGTPA